MSFLFNNTAYNLMTVARKMRFSSWVRIKRDHQSSLMEGMVERLDEEGRRESP